MLSKAHEVLRKLEFLGMDLRDDIEEEESQPAEMVAFNKYWTEKMNCPTHLIQKQNPYLKWNNFYEFDKKKDGDSGRAV
jgi:hypothetical protein